LLSGRDGEEFARRFRAEAETVARLRHAHIVQVQALTTIRGRPAIVMEYLEGGNLADRIKQGALSLEDALKLMLAMADALAYAHKLEIVHRDFKPANIMYTADGMPVLTDFGIARANVAAGGTSTHTVVGTVIGTANYMAPEQALGKAVGPAADMYAFGKVLFEVLTSKLPPAEASRGSDEDRIEAILERFVDMRASHAGPIAELVAKCLDPNEDLRPTAVDARNALQDLVDRLEGGGALARYKPALIGLGIGASAAIAILAGISILGGSPQTVPIANVESPAPVAAANTPWLTRLRAALPAGATLHLDGAPLAPELPVLPNTGTELVIVAPGHVGRIVDLSEPT
ncbi:MAG: serine/threonine protein kinase, partial [Pseudomonadales bacterium]|nr:serine/threonine protein kinase [Pseudomonadales bacterium]